MKMTYCALIVTFVSAPSIAWSDAKIIVTPDASHPGGKVKVKGSGFQADESIDVRWDSNKLLFTISSDSSGKFSKQKAKVPKSALPGAHTINANGASGDSAQSAFAVSTPWVEFGFSPHGGRENPYENVISKENVAKLAELWTATTGNFVLSCCRFHGHRV